MAVVRLNDFLEELAPGQGKAKAEGKCPICGKQVGEFRDALSVAEFKISGLCQECQDETF